MLISISSGALFCLVYGFSNAATRDWSTPSTWGFLVAASCCSPGLRSGRAGPPTHCFRRGPLYRKDSQDRQDAGVVTVEAGPALPA